MNIKIELLIFNIRFATEIMDVFINLVISESVFYRFTVII